MTGPAVLRRLSSFDLMFLLMEQDWAALTRRGRTPTGPAA